MRWLGSKIEKRLCITETNRHLQVVYFLTAVRRGFSQSAQRATNQSILNKHLSQIFANSGLNQPELSALLIELILRATENFDAKLAECIAEFAMFSKYVLIKTIRF